MTKRKKRYNYREVDFAKQIKQYQQQRWLLLLHFGLFVFLGCGILSQSELWEYWVLLLGLHWFWFMVIYRRQMRHVRRFLRWSRRDTVTVPIPPDHDNLDYMYTADGEILEVVDSRDSA